MMIRRAASLLMAVVMALMPLPALATDAIKFYIMIDVPVATDQLALDRWYLTYHSQQMHRAMRAWQRNYVSYRSYPVPSEADRYSVWRGRLTEIQYDSLDDFREGRRNNPYLDLLTPPPGGWKNTIFRSEPIVIPVNPAEVYLQGATPPKETPYLRWVLFFRYPEGVDTQQGERWFLDTQVKELSKLPGLRRYIGYQASGKESRYTRVVELWFDDYAAWRKAFVENPPSFTPPPWGGSFPFVEFISTFVGENPDMDFLNDRRVIP